MSENEKTVTPPHVGGKDQFTYDDLASAIRRIGELENRITKLEKIISGLVNNQDFREDAGY